jgi:hypothetical protein
MITPRITRSPAGLLVTCSTVLVVLLEITPWMLPFRRYNPRYVDIVDQVAKPEFPFEVMLRNEREEGYLDAVIVISPGTIRPRM